MSAARFVLSPKVVTRDEQGRCLLIRRSDECRNNKGKWDLPGGKAEPGEEFEHALLREAEEETGLRVALDHVAGCAESVLGDRVVCYMILEGYVVQGVVRLSSEHQDYAWVERERLAEMDVCPQFRAFFAAYARGEGPAGNSP